MSYLIMQMLICLLIAFILGLILGWLLCKLFGCCKAKGASCDTAVAPAMAAVPDVVDLDTSVNLDGDGYGIETLEGIGPQTGDSFRGYGVATVGDYLRKLNQPEQREEAAASLGMSRVKMLHDWASMSDLLRVDGIDHQYSELTWAAGVHTVADLAGSNAAALTAEMERVNNAGKQLIAPTVPTQSEVSSWISRAKNMKAVVRV